MSSSPAVTASRFRLRLFLLFAACTALAGPASHPAHAAEQGEDGAAKQEEASEAPATDPSSAKKSGKEGPSLPFITINRKQRYIDVEGEVCLREGLLELAATIRGGKEHEAVFVIDARPRHLHFALLTLGLEPGRPGKWRYINDKPMPIDPTGDPVRITVRYQGEEGEPIAHPVGHFIRDRASGDSLGRTRFVFAGSRIKEGPDGEPIYRADSSGDVVSLVSFNDELLALPTAASNSNEKLVWEANTPAIPPVGRGVVLRIRPAEPAKPPAEGDQPDDPAANADPSASTPDGSSGDSPSPSED